MISDMELLKDLDYDPDTGVFTWGAGAPKIVRGKPAGGLGRQGYMRIKIKGKKYALHRLAWLWYTGTFPPEDLDHINGVKADNRLLNLRAVTTQENMRNVAKWRNNSSGVTGVQWNKAHAAWHVRIGVGGKYKHLGYFKDFNEAVAVRKEAEVHYGYHENHGRDAV